MRLLIFVVVLLNIINYVYGLTLAQLTTQINARGGKVIPQADGPNFNNARFGYNYRYNRIPTVIIQPSDTASVQLVLEYAQTNNLKVSIKSGGHSSISEGVMDNRVTIDLSQMKQISYDNVTRIITTQSGNKWVEFYDYTINQHGVATPGGSCPSVSIGGLTLGGGANDLSTLYGLATDNVVEMEVVLANRTIVTASETENSDLFWALRGGGHGGFGVVTQFKFKAYQVQPVYYSAWITWAWSDFEAVLTYVNQFSQFMPNSVNLYFTAWRSKDAATPSVALSCFYNGNKDDAEQFCGRFRSIPNVVTPPEFQVTNTSYYNTVKGGTDPKARQSYTKGGFLTDITKQTVRRIKTAMESSPLTPYSYNTARLNLYWQGGAMLEKSRGYNAYPHRSYPWNAVWLTSFVGSEFDEMYNKWITKTYRQMNTFSQGVYQNYPDDTLENWADEYYMENYPLLKGG
ncbi:hypothetical protein DICPUDRAFT_149614 [Dictyostelium purpureum]|uniref:FAD-binding PCMH-type domain-containing protein n=1 Tax=Dictyostelium purpureum TaxID=5786 RepID=F0ZE48_DICPU|nr:uncharacterized protein DICPUDRAFT_149614 [Dictyostelium purpureum]EGC37785.1 hypothetical protein DICPUDRAFT_149614 [Dictyostelium purpureum]|eukprot:XP_003285724.1 hypothetical protein DICPUDRAFT_149614 [Dictyostelium purpureum]